jgi:hypothetical protein
MYSTVANVLQGPPESGPYLIIYFLYSTVQKQRVSTDSGTPQQRRNRAAFTKAGMKKMTAASHRNKYRKNLRKKKIGKESFIDYLDHYSVRMYRYPVSDFI